ncbi:hypothetical protein [Rhodococcus sp. AW25M09]|uniref:hypothetical protein n=1 Tax=Rhodococcus sp. AW25M09 TaxID=1268303 RepID=UPI001E3386B0|nr:hypothetical protein [Rhodococcus sp. AW25M09]
MSAATLYNWRRQYAGMDTDAAKELKGASRAERQAQTAARRGRAGEGCTAGGSTGKF